MSLSMLLVLSGVGLRTRVADGAGLGRGGGVRVGGTVNENSGFNERSEPLSLHLPRESAERGTNSLLRSMRIKIFNDFGGYALK